MSVVNGQPVDAAVTNAAFMSRLVDTSTEGKVKLDNTVYPESGAAVDNAQRAFNETFDAVGMTGEGDLTRNDYATNNVVTNGQDRKQAISSLDATFDSATGHNHDGTPGNGQPISGADLIDFNKYFAHWQDVVVLAAAGTSDDVSALFAAKTPGGNASNSGVITTAPSNKVAIYASPNLDGIEDAEGQKVYGRLTESAGVWALEYFTNEAGVETAHSLASQDIKIFFLEVFDQDTRPTIPSTPEFGSLDTSADVVDASSSQRGLVSVLAQEFSGLKTFLGGIKNNGTTALDIEDDAISTGANVSLSAPTKSILRLTNAGLVSVDRLQGGTTGKILILINATGVDITLLSATGAPASDQFILPANMPVPNTGAVLLAYDSVQSRWLAIGGGAAGANKFLSNLEALTAVNSTLTPGVAGLDLGNPSVFVWSTIYGENLQADASVRTAQINDTADLISLSPLDRRLYDTDGDIALDWQARLLKASDGTTVADFSSPTGIDLQALELKNLLDPTLAQSAVTKAWAEANLGGGGGGSLEWLDDGGVAPAASFDGFRRIFAFLNGDTQELNATVRVPASYMAGKPVNLRTVFHCPDSTGTVQIQATARLFRPGTSLFSAALDTRVSTNPAVTMTVGNQNRLIALVFDLSSSLGVIGATAIQAGDEISIELTRAADTATGNANVAIFTGEVTFK